MTSGAELLGNGVAPERIGLARARRGHSGRRLKDRFLTAAPATRRSTRDTHCERRACP